MKNKNIPKKNKNKKNKQNKKSLKKKGQDMTFGFGKKEEGKKNWWQKNLLTKPKELQDPNTLSVVLFSQKTLNEIAEICLPNAKQSEFQIHYRGVQIIVQGATKRISFTIPTVFFNMPQKVSSASVDFNLDQVAAISEDVAPISEEMSKEILKNFPLEFFRERGFGITKLEYEMGSIHRHPGNFGFSSTDLDNQVEEPGVIFRNLEVQDKIQIDSVMYIPHQSVSLVTTETRVVDVYPAEDGGIEGTYKRAGTISYIIDDDEEPMVDFHEFFGAPEKDSNELRFTVDSDRVDGEYPEIETIFGSFLENFDYEPVLIIDPELIEQAFGRSYYTKKYPKYNKAGTGHTYQNKYAKTTTNDDIWGNQDDWDAVSLSNEWDVDIDSDQLYYPEEKPAEPLQTRPTWRKVQVVNKLKTVYKIKTDQEPGISGDASEKDIIAIATAMKNYGHGDYDIRNFFVEMGYPTNALELYYKDLT